MSYYKYRDVNDLRKFIDIIMNKRLFMSNYKDFNDPAEGFYLTNGQSTDVLRWIREGKKKELICCLSMCKNHSLLWSHYADGHKGVCIEVEVTSPIEPVEVKYVNTMPFVENFDDSVVRHVLSYKSSFWSYEQEIRYFNELVDGKRVLNYLRVKVLRVYLGVKMDAKQARFLTKLVKSIDQSIKVVQMKNVDIDWGYENYVKLKASETT